MSIRLSPEQEAILATAEAPSATSSKLVRITAAAGTGKTTTLLHLADRCAELDHSHLTYITFNKSAAADGRARLEQSLHKTRRIQIDARTLHSCAMNLLSIARQEEDFDEELVEEKLVHEDGLKDEIQRLLQDEINAFLGPCRREIHRASSKKSQRERSRHVEAMEAFAEKQVIFFLYKTLVQFCHSASTIEAFRDPNSWSRHYYPVTKFHQVKGKAAGFDPGIYNKNKIKWYADQACRLWDMLAHVKNYDLEMKRAQLMGLEIPGSLILVDECQDMDGCQVEWVSQQYQYNKLIYMVGDAAQTIYSFRGAKSKFMMELKYPATDCTLTKSWRFGPPIAKLANLVLFVKEHCPQTTNCGKAKTWQPYRVTGGSPVPCQVTDEPLRWQDHQVTLIAFKNATLMMEAVKMLGLPEPTSGDADDDDTDDDDDDDDAMVPIVSEDSVLPDSLESAPPESPSAPLGLPKIHINGKGDNSGMKKWKQILTQIEHLFNLYRSEDGMVLPRRHFPEMFGQAVTWDSFTKQVEDRELNKYAASIGVICAFRERTMEAMNLFEEEVMNKAYSADEADIILSTTHAAKGMEWDNVQVCDDFTDEVSKVDRKGPPRIVVENGKRSKIPNTWQFATKNYGDDLNLLYVACTRAKRLLSIPTSLKTLLQQCDMLHDILQAKQRVKQEHQAKKQKTAGIILFEKQLTNEEASDLYTQLFAKLRKEAGVPDTQGMLDTLLKRLYPSQDDNVDIISDTELSETAEEVRVDIKPENVQSEAVLA